LKLNQPYINMKRVFRSLFYLSLIALAAGFFWYRYEMKNAVPGEKETETRAFHGIKASGAFEIHLHKGETYDIQIKADNQNWLDDIRTEVKNGILHIHHEGNAWIFGKDGIELDITAPDINWISVSGAARLETEAPLSGEELYVKVSGAGDLDIDAEVSVFTAILSGTGNLELEGSAEEASFKISGVGNIDAFDFKANRVKAKISGTGNAEVYASEVIDAKISGAGNISYRGNPKEVISNVSGAGSINQK